MLEVMARRGGIDRHAADRVGRRVTIRHHGRVVIVAVHCLGSLLRAGVGNGRYTPPG